ncbi:hypothetical protein [Promicromonospora sp. NFX87]|uniref:hypothetical protein n=1 Tax=Promicromonospora sp. NFX87 TaxID=3402691 RepID=UPI003AFAD6EA
MFIEEPRALDAFAYRGHLFVLTFDGCLITYNISQIASSLDEEHGDDGLVAAYGLFSSKGIGASPRMKSAWKRFDHSSSRSLELPSSPVATSPFAIEASAHLDMRVYYNRVFVATDRGTFWAPLESTGQVSSDRDAVRSITRAPTESLSTGMGAVGASLGEEGLAIFARIYAEDCAPENRLLRRSIRSTIGWGSAVNYPTHDSYEVLESTIVEDGQGRKELLGVHASSSSKAAGVDVQRGGYVTWESGRLLLADAVSVSSFGRASSSSRRRTLARAGGGDQPLWVGVTGNRCIVTETADRISVAKADQYLILHEGPAASVRTFSGSQRYQRLVAATVDGGLLLSAVFRSDKL